MSKWKKVKLRDYIEQIRGVSYNPKDVSNVRTDTHVPILRANNIQDDGLNFTDLIYVDKRKIKDYQYIRKGDIVICASSGSKNLVGKAAQLNEDKNITVSFGAFCKVVRTQKIYAPYLGYYFKSKNYRNLISSLSAGANINNIKNEHIDELEIPLPPTDVQKYIVKVLDAASKLLAMRKQQLAELDKLIKSTFYDMFGDPFENPRGWPKSPLSDLAIIIMGQSPNGNSYNDKGLGIPLLNGPTEFGDKYPKEKQWTLEPTKMCEADDILFCVRGATAGRMNIADKGYCIGRGLAAIRPKQLNMQAFIYQYLNMMYEYFQLTSNGSTFINISKETLNNLPVLNVCTNVQEKFSRIVTRIEDQKSLVQKALDETQYLFDSLMSEYFD